MNRARPILVTLAILEATTFFLGAAAHLGEPLALGPIRLAEPRIVPATVVESLCGAALLIAAYAIARAERWTWPVAIGGHAFAAGGVLLGMAALALGRGPRTDSNDLYHLVMLTVLSATLLFLVSPSGRRAVAARTSSRA